jgi:hypothetical protein
MQTGTDFERWKKLSQDWPDRLAIIAKRIQAGSRVIDLGAGIMTLRDHLPDSCHYTACDCVGHAPDSIVCDFNSGEFPARDHYDVAVASGLLEYLDDLPAFLKRLAGLATRAIVTYKPASAEELPKDRERWNNAYTEDELCGHFREAELRIHWVGQWGPQKIFDLESGCTDLS